MRSVGSDVALGRREARETVAGWRPRLGTTPARPWAQRRACMDELGWQVLDDF